MSSQKEGRIDDGLKALILTFFPNSQDPNVSGEEIEALEEQREDIHDRYRAPLRHKAKTFSKRPEDVFQDIRTHLLQTSHTKDAANRFGSFYSRLMALPIINNKAGILHLLHELAPDDADDEASDGFEAAAPPRSQGHQRVPSRSPRKEPQQQQQQQQQQQPPPPPPSQRDPPIALERGQNGLTEAPSSRLNRQGTDIDAPKTPREAYLRAQITSRQSGRETASYPDSPRGIQAAQSGEVEAPINKSPAESSLLRDLPFVLQGLSTNNFVFSNGEKLALPTELPLPLVSILHTLAEPSLLYRQLHAFAHSSRQGLVMQALQATIETQLRAYLGLISTLEGEIRRCLMMTATTTGSENTGNAGESSADVEQDRRSQAISMSRVGVTLKRCVVWTRDATLGLRLLSSLAEEADSMRLKGGALISLVHRFAKANGDPFVSGFAERMLVHLARPFYDMLRQWIYDGELRDPYAEFFVYEVDADDDEIKAGQDAKKMLATSVWDNKYKMKPELVPTIVDEDFASKVFLIGKSLNFIRHSCGDSSWVEQYSKEHSRELSYGDTATLESSIHKAYKMSMAHLIHLLDARFGLFSHLDALKRYLLLGQGDFVALLIESLASNLDKPAGTQYRHTLTAQLDHAIRGSNAQFDSPELLRRLDARLLELTHGEIGWDVFTLEYKVDAPCDVVVTTWANRQYLSVFNLLWRIKRLEFALGGTWRRVTTGARTVLASTVGRSGSNNGNMSTAASDLSSDWKAARCTLSAMVHFITQLQYYVMVEVIEASWNTLQKEIRREGVTLDGMIEAHALYLRTITHRALLGGSKYTLTGNREDSFPAQMHKLLKAMLSYTESVDGLYAYSVGEFTKMQEAAARAEAKTRPGVWGLEDNDELDSPLPGAGQQGMTPGGWAGSNGAEVDSPAGQIPGLSGLTGGGDTMLPALRKRMMELSSEFRTRLETLLGDLLMQPDQELKFLGVAMNYNDVYKPVRRKKRRDREKERGAERGRERADSRPQ